jgi:hypothetical protein
VLQGQGSRIFGAALFSVGRKEVEVPDGEVKQGGEDFDGGGE